MLQMTDLNYQSNGYFNSSIPLSNSPKINDYVLNLQIDELIKDLIIQSEEIIQLKLSEEEKEDLSTYLFEIIHSYISELINQNPIINNLQSPSYLYFPINNPYYPPPNYQSNLLFPYYPNYYSLYPPQKNQLNNTPQYSTLINNNYNFQQPQQEPKKQKKHESKKASHSKSKKSQKKSPKPSLKQLKKFSQKR